MGRVPLAEHDSMPPCIVNRAAGNVTIGGTDWLEIKKKTLPLMFIDWPYLLTLILNKSHLAVIEAQITSKRGSSWHNDAHMYLYLWSKVKLRAQNNPWKNSKRWPLLALKGYCMSLLACERTCRLIFGRRETTEIKKYVYSHRPVCSRYSPVVSIISFALCETLFFEAVSWNGCLLPLTKLSNNGSFIN